VYSLPTSRKLNDVHNHELTTETIGHSIVRRPNAPEKERIGELGECGVAPKAISSTLKTEFNNHYTTAGEVYNELTKVRQEFLDGRIPIEALIDMLSKDNFVHHVWLEENRVFGVFFAHKHSIQLCQQFSTVFLMDCTYQTNKFGVPLLNIIGLTYRLFPAHCISCLTIRAG
jgi:hypothetical protein